LNKQQDPRTNINIKDRQITLLGTAHVSRSSVEDVSTSLNSGLFDAVAVELCSNRHNAIMNPDSLAKMDLFQVLRDKKTTMVIANLALGAYQQRIADEIGIEPGAEMKAAIQLADKLKLPVLLIDREISTTLKRVYANVSWWRRFELIAGLLASVVNHEKVSEEEIEKLKQGDMLESALHQFAEQNESLFKPLIQERDEYMSMSLFSQLETTEYSNILAVVGAGHVAGMSTRLKNTPPSTAQIDESLSRLKHVPKRSRWLKSFPWLIVLLVLVGFGIGFSRNTELGLDIMLDWVLINGGLSALGALLAAAHPLTILVAFIAAPLTSLNPMIGAGFVTAATEIFIRKPEVGDFSQLRTDVSNLKGWWHNRVARTLLIFLFSTIGSAIGTYVAGFRIFEKLTLG